MRSYLKKPFTKTGLVEWLKVKALSSNSSTTKKKKKKERKKGEKKQHIKHDLLGKDLNTLNLIAWLIL
jgi:ribosomal protein S21